MAKVKIQGNASGTGVLSVTAPNTSTDRTITLPDATGTLLNSDGDGSSLTGVADATKLPLAGGTMTGNLVVGGGAAPRISITSNNANGSSAVNFLSTTNNSKNWEVGSNLHNSDGLEFTPSTANGNSTFTTPTVSFPVAGGITFGSDTAAANALDDYEEGTWSPIFRGSSGSAGSWAQSGVTSTYTKIGRTVYIACAGYLSNVGSWSGNAEMAGLPFANSFGEHIAITISGFPNTTTYGTGTGSQPLITCVVGAGSSEIYFKAGAGQDPAVPYSIVRTGYYFQVAGTYIAT